MATWTDYPMLYKLLKEAAADSSMELAEAPDWPETAPLLEEEANRLNATGLDFPDDTKGSGYENEVRVMRSASRGT